MISSELRNLMVSVPTMIVHYRHRRCWDLLAIIEDIIMYLQRKSNKSATGVPRSFHVS